MRKGSLRGIMTAGRMFLAAALLCSGLAWAGPPIVHIAAGNLRGLAERGGVRAFKGVPYARAPIGPLRWKPPEPAKSWAGTRPAGEIGQACMQPVSGANDFYAYASFAMSEDCLTLNVWAPANAKGSAVMVFLHGGGFVTGSGGVRMYDATKLARRGVIVVTANYRLGVFGFLAHPELSAESEHGVSGNYGLLDQFAALRWVQHNISAFGGDPGRVTIFGESAGGISVALLMTSPMATGLFQRAIIESAPLWALPNLRRPSLDFPPAEAAGLAFGRDRHVPTLADLRSLSAKELLTVAADNPVGNKGVASPVVDGWVVPAQIYETFEAGREAKVPLIAGFNSGEMTGFGPEAMPPVAANRSQYEAAIRASYGDLAPLYLSLYPASAIGDSSVRAATEGFFGWGPERLVQLHQRAGQSVWFYYFDHTYPSELMRGIGAFHGSELPFVFGHVGAGVRVMPNWPDPPAQPEDHAMSEILMDYWTAFAKDGKPSAPGRPTWPAFTGVEGGYLALRNGQAIPASNLRPGMFAVHDATYRRLRAAGRAWTWDNIGAWAPPPDKLN
jgi:para-nitrobenzyl esterase